MTLTDQELHDIIKEWRADFPYTENEIELARRVRDAQASKFPSDARVGTLLAKYKSVFKNPLNYL